MSKSFRAAQVIRCPFCYSGSSPIHVGHSVMVCQPCGNTFRVVHADKGRTGMSLGRKIEEVVVWQKNEQPS